MARAYFLQVAVAADQLLNALLGGWADETFSSRVYREGPRWLERIINFLFLDRDHCYKSFRAERVRLQLPPELRLTQADLTHTRK